MILIAAITVSLMKVYNYFTGKNQLEELKKLKKSKEPILTLDEKASKSNKHEIKGTGKFLDLITIK